MHSPNFRPRFTASEQEPTYQAPAELKLLEALIRSAALDLRRRGNFNQHNDHEPREAACAWFLGEPALISFDYCCKMLKIGYAVRKRFELLAQRVQAGERLRTKSAHYGMCATF